MAVKGSTKIHANDPFEPGHAKCGAETDNRVSIDYFMQCADNPSPVRSICHKCRRSILGFDN